MTADLADQRPDASLVLRRAVAQIVLLRHGMAQPSPSTVALLIEREGFDAGQEVEQAKAKDAGFLRDAGLWELLTPSEREFMTEGMKQVTVSQLRSATSLVEPLCCLFWALGRVDRIPPYDQHSELAGPCELLLLDPAKILSEEARLREAEEIDKAQKTAECWLWRSRMRELQENGHFDTEAGARSLVFSPEEVIRLRAEQAFEEGDAPPPLMDDFSAFTKPYRNLSSTEWAQARSIAVERFRTLSWLCGLAPENRWERIPVDDISVTG